MSGRLVLAGIRLEDKRVASGKTKRGGCDYDVRRGGERGPVAILGSDERKTCCRW